MPSMPGSGTVVPPEVEEVVEDDVAPPDVEEVVAPPEVDDVVAPPEVEDVEAPPEVEDVVEPLDVDDDELDEPHMALPIESPQLQ